VTAVSALLIPADNAREPHHIELPADSDPRVGDGDRLGEALGRWIGDDIGLFWLGDGYLAYAPLDGPVNDRATKLVERLWGQDGDGRSVYGDMIVCMVLGLVDLTESCVERLLGPTCATRAP
jgi:hypothetical protein